MLKRIVLLVAALTLAGGVFLTAQAVSSHRGPLPHPTAPLTIAPGKAQPTSGEQSNPSPGVATPTTPRCDDDGYGSPVWTMRKRAGSI